MAVSPPILEALAFGASDGAVGALLVVYAELGARVVAKIKFHEITMQVLFLAVLIHAAHPALEN